jgi:hypothetical protein
VHRKAIELGDPAVDSLLITYMAADEIDALFADLEARGADAPHLAAARKAYEQGGRMGLARVVLRPYYYDEAGRPLLTSPAALAVYEAMSGNKEKALDLLEKSFEERDAFLIYCIRSPALDSLRSEPRLKSLLRDLNIPE